MLKIENLEISYGESPVVQNLSTTIEKGSFIGLIGPNGAGKTSLLLTISGQFKPQGGTVQFNNYDIYEKNAAARQEIHRTAEKD
jgi:ABC-type multidrug transport system ATPase subunit